MKIPKEVLIYYSKGDYEKRAYAEEQLKPIREFEKEYFKHKEGLC